MRQACPMATTINIVAAATAETPCQSSHLVAHYSSTEGPMWRFKAYVQHVTTVPNAVCVHASDQLPRTTALKAGYILYQKVYHQLDMPHRASPGHCTLAGRPPWVTVPAHTHLATTLPHPAAAAPRAGSRCRWGCALFPCWLRPPPPQLPPPHQTAPDSRRWCRSAVVPPPQRPAELALACRTLWWRYYS